MQKSPKQMFLYCLNMYWLNMQLEKVVQIQSNKELKYLSIFLQHI